MGRRSKNENLLDMLVEALSSLFQLVPPWTSIPAGLLGGLVIVVWWHWVMKVPQVRILGIYLGIGFALICFIAGWQGWLFRQRQREFLGTEIDIDWARGLTWRDFESQLASVYRQQGYEVTETGGGGPDGGIDLKLFRDNHTTVVQCKHWKTWKVNVKPVRELFGVMNAEHADAAIFINSGDYTADARNLPPANPSN